MVEILDMIFFFGGIVAQGIYKAMLTENVNTVYNLSSQTETSLLELVQIMGKVSGRDIVPNFRPVRDGDIYYLVSGHRGGYVDAIISSWYHILEYVVRSEKGKLHANNSKDKT